MLPLGRLFWKFFAAILLAILTFFFGGIAFFMLSDRHHDHEMRNAEAMILLDSASATVQAGGVAALTPLLKQWNQQQSARPRLYASDASGRPLPGSIDAPPDGDEWRDITGQDGHHLKVAVQVPTGLLPPHPPTSVPILSGVLVSLLFSGFLAWYLTRPIRVVRRALQEVAQGNFEVRVQAEIGSRRDEIADLGRDVDSMAVKLHQLVNAQQRLLHDVSHELRSPLTRLRLAVGLLRKSDGKSHAMLGRIEQEADRLETLVQETLTLARLEAGQTPLQRQRVDVIDLLAAIVEDASFEARQRNCTVTFTHPEHFIAHVDGDLIYRALENVIRNAIKFTAPETTVTIDANIENDGNSLVVKVQDQGPGVPPDLLDQMFEPFRQIDSGGGQRGFGLGLAIARRALETHGGQITALLPPEGGLCVRLCMSALAEPKPDTPST